MKYISTVLAAAGMAGLANAALKQDRRQVDPHTCACGPGGGPQTVTVTQTVSVPALPSGYGGAGGQTELISSSTAVPANSTLVSPVETSAPPVVPSQTSYRASIVTVTVTNAIGQPSVVTTTARVPIPSKPYYPVPGNLSVIMPTGSGGTAPPPNTEVSPTLISSLPSGVSVTELTSVYVTTCAQETTITSGSHTLTSTGTKMIRSTITSTIQSTVTATIPGKSNSTEVSPTLTSAPPSGASLTTFVTTVPEQTTVTSGSYTFTTTGTRRVRSTITSTIESTVTAFIPTASNNSTLAIKTPTFMNSTLAHPIVSTGTVTSKAPNSTVASYTSVPTSGTLTVVRPSSQPYFSSVPSMNSSLASPESTGSSYIRPSSYGGLPSGVPSNTINSTVVPTNVEVSPVQTTTSASGRLPPSYGAGYSSAPYSTHSSEVSPVQTTASASGRLPPSYGAGYSSAPYSTHSSKVSPVQTTAASGRLPPSYGTGYSSAPYSKNSSEASPVGGTSSVPVIATKKPLYFHPTGTVSAHTPHSTSSASSIVIGVPKSIPSSHSTSAAPSSTEISPVQASSTSSAPTPAGYARTRRSAKADGGVLGGLFGRSHARAMRA